MHPFTIINKLFNTNFKSKKEIEEEYQAAVQLNNILTERNERLEQDILDYSHSLSDINFQLREKEEEVETLREEMTAHYNTDNDISKVIFEITIDEDEELIVVPKTQYNSVITNSLVSNGYISLEDSHDDFATHVGMILCAYDACDTIVNNFKGEE
jgi:hypothetical protein